MAKLADINESEWEAWLAERPDCIKAMAAKWPPNLLYRLKTTDQRVTIAAYNENGTIRVNVPPEYNPFQFFPFGVFGIDPDDLKECEIPEIERFEIHELDRGGIGFSRPGENFKMNNYKQILSDKDKP